MGLVKSLELPDLIIRWSAFHTVVLFLAAKRANRRIDMSISRHPVCWAREMKDSNTSLSVVSVLLLGR